MESKTLQQADKIIHGERQDVYGNPEDSFLKVAEFWNAYIRNKRSFTCNLNEKDVALMMTLFKIAREQGTGHKRDNAVDACGYLAIYNDRLFPEKPSAGEMFDELSRKYTDSLFPEKPSLVEMTNKLRTEFPAFFTDGKSMCERVNVEVQHERKERKQRTLLVDGDIVLYLNAFANQKKIVWDEETVSEAIDFDKACADVDTSIIRGARRSRCDDALVCLSCPSKDNFRKVIFPDYKANRKDKELPILYHRLREYLRHNYEIVIKPSLEADDVLGILSTRHPDKYVIMSTDKDLKQIPGLHFNWKENKIEKVTKHEGNRWFYMQIIMGDTTDNYKGIPGAGIAKATKIVDEYLYAGEDKVWTAIVAAYADKGLTEDDALTMARVARILRAEDYDFEKKEVKLWQPKKAT